MLLNPCLWKWYLLPYLVVPLISARVPLIPTRVPVHCQAMFIQLTKTWSAPVLPIRTLHNKYTNSILRLKNMNSWSCKTDPHSSAVVPSQERRCLWFRLHLDGCEGISYCQYSYPYLGLLQLCFSKRWLLTLLFCTSLAVQPNIQSLPHMSVVVKKLWQRFIKSHMMSTGT